MKAVLRAMRGLLIAWTALAACVAHAAANDTDEDATTYYAEDPGTYGSVKAVLPPTYPPAALQAATSGFVMVTGVLLPDGILDAKTFEPDRPESEVFVDPLREVIPYWEFRVPVGANCMPSEKPFSVRVDFEVRDGKPHVYVTHAPGKAAGKAAPRRLQPLSKVDLEYPPSMLRNGLQGVVFARSDVDAEGNVVAVEARAYARRYASQLTPFAQEAEQKLKQWRYPPAPGVPVRHFCFDILYRLRR